MEARAFQLERQHSEAVARGFGSSSDDPALLLGSVVDGRYLLERVIGRGGFGVVYRATHLRFDSPVAIKVLRSRQQGYPEATLRRFIQEGRLLFRLGGLHSAIVRVFEAGLTSRPGAEPTPYIAMEWLDGVDLEHEIRHRRSHGMLPLAVAELFELLDSIAEGLAVAHRLCIAHLDIKPANIFLAHSQDVTVPKILDFGLAQVLNLGDACVARAPSLREGSPGHFTPAYAAPEQWSPAIGVSGTWTDVHALALICVELLSGRRAWHGSGSDALRTACLAPKARPTPRALGVDVPDAVERVFESALAFDPVDRYRDVASFWEAFRHATGVAPRSDRRPFKVLAMTPRAAQPDTVSRLPTARTASIGRRASPAVHAPEPRTERTGSRRGRGAAWLLGAALFPGTSASTVSLTPKTPDAVPNVVASLSESELTGPSLSVAAALPAEPVRSEVELRSSDETQATRKRAPSAPRREPPHPSASIEVPSVPEAIEPAPAPQAPWPGVRTNAGLSVSELVHHEELARRK